MKANENILIPKLRFPKFKDSGEWEKKKLGDIGEIITGKTPSTSNKELWKDGVLFVTPSDIKGCKYQTKTDRMVTNYNIKILPAGTILFSCIATIGKITIAKEFCTTNQQINSIIVDEKKAYNEYIYYNLQSIISKIKAKYEKDAFSIINKTEFSNILLLVSPLNDEQQKIADFLSSIDELIELEQKKLEKLKEYKKGLLQNLFPKENQKVPDIRFPEFEESGEWEEKRLGEMVDILDNLRRPIAKHNRLQGQYPYYGANGVMDYVNDYIFDGTYLLIGEDGSVINKDNSPVLHIATGKFWVNNHAHIVKEKNILFDLYFIYYALQNISIEGFVKGIPPKLNQESLRNINILVPDTNEQQKIADFLSAIDELIELEQKKLEKLKEYKKGLLQQLFPNE